MTLFVFCWCAASADLGMRDTGRQQLYLANRPPLVSAFSALLACPLTECLPVPFNSVSETNRPDVVQLMRLARQKISNSVSPPPVEPSVIVFIEGF